MNLDEMTIDEAADDLERQRLEKVQADAEREFIIYFKRSDQDYERWALGRAELKATCSELRACGYTITGTSEITDADEMLASKGA